MFSNVYFNGRHKPIANTLFFATGVEVWKKPWSPKISIGFSWVLSPREFAPYCRDWRVKSSQHSLAPATREYQFCLAGFVFAFFPWEIFISTETKTVRFVEWSRYVFFSMYNMIWIIKFHTQDAPCVKNIKTNLQNTLRIETKNGHIDWFNCTTGWFQISLFSTPNLGVSFSNLTCA